MPSGETLRVVTYNIHRCIGTDGRGSVDRVARVLGELRPDLVALQEVLSSERVPNPGQLERLADATGLQPVAGGTLVEEDARYGNGLLLRAPPAKVERHDLSVPGAEPRGALEVVVETAAGPARVITTHLGLRARERRRQIERLEAILAARPEPVLALLGDVNEWRPRPLVASLARLSRVLRPVPVARTFPSRRPMVGLDRIWIGPGADLLASGPHRSALAREASDHLPFFAEVRAPAGGEGMPGA
jgi:endonuclease/exonuclease/phosphatase family metal-dependent hydrolase